MAGGWRTDWTSARKRLSCVVWIHSAERSARASASDTSRLSPRPCVADTAMHPRALAQLGLNAGRRRRPGPCRVRSHLLSAITVAHFFFIASSAMRRSSLVTPSEASQTTIATSARSAARSERSWA